MNFAAHVAVAAQHWEHPDILLGAALPDIAANLGVTIAAPSGQLAQGIAHHHAADGVFHGSNWFVTRMAACSRELQRQDVRRGPARGVAHVGVELLLDGAVLSGPLGEAFRSVWTRLQAPDDVVAEAIVAADRDAWLLRLQRYTTLLDPWRYREPEYVAGRVADILARRPRLAMNTRETTLVADALRSVAPQVVHTPMATIAAVAEEVRFRSALPGATREGR